MSDDQVPFEKIIETLGSFKLLPSSDLVLHSYAIGEVAQAWSSFELTIDMYCLGVADVSVAIGSCFTSQIAGVSRKLDAYSSLAKLKKKLDKELLGKLNKFSAKAVSLAERRNRVIHDVWFPFEQTGLIKLNITARKGLKFSFDKKSIDGILSLSKEITALRAEFKEIAELIIASQDAGV